jgi:hypothetical protein
MRTDHLRRTWARLRRSVLLAAALGVGLGTSTTPLAQGTALAAYKIVTASERGTYIQIGRDLAKLVAPAAGIDLAVLPSAGSAENVQRLRHEEGVKLAMVQSDVYQAFLDEAAGGNAQAQALITPLRVVMPLYNEEIYFIVRADSPLQYVHEIRGKRINAGPLRSGTALSTATLYRRMFGEAIAPEHEQHLTNEDALKALVTGNELDVVVVVAGQPAKLLVDMTPEARRYIRLLKVDPQQPASKAALEVYFPATIKAANYPNLLPEDIPGLAVKAFLVTYNYQLPETVSRLQRFAQTLCRARDTLREQGHPKWKEVSFELPPLGRGWSYYRPTTRELQACGTERAAAPAAPSARTVKPARCTPQQYALGLCN